MAESANKYHEKEIIDWMNTSYPLNSKKVESLDSLADGNILIEIMFKAAPLHFELDKINHYSGDNWALKLKNLIYLYDGLQSYYSNVLGEPFGKEYIDLPAIAKEGDRDHLVNLVICVATAIHLGEQKQSVFQT